MFIRKARVTEAKEIKAIIDYYSDRGVILPRTLDEIYKYIRDFTVCTIKQKIIGVCALSFFTEEFAEIRTLAVLGQYKKQNIGSLLVKSCIKEAIDHKIKTIFTLTYIPDYFKKLNFRNVDKGSLPHKIWRDCINCEHFYNCNEEAMVNQLDKKNKE